MKEYHGFKYDVGYPNLILSTYEKLGVEFTSDELSHVRQGVSHDIMRGLKYSSYGIERCEALVLKYSDQIKLINRMKKSNMNLIK